ncbi:bifunctional pantoate--beta-alanine ligase/(d)CMP kinase [Prochlorothrix hollandica]|uniref:Bifunctional pantoate ligase/cytidylate kinase n=3 Tax=Prochlorothrix hollandica TaxID=1223 RepID=A0A0M2PVU1_PROHO|nr:bifunctional pantoate--beta-alanine ligase/(d)CMP kinase [Prochlorothrix hollandica]KKI99212.1 cytidylate kinase [Prochlorothrix hollandica PCC 9006 = CALU 1027]
MRCLKTVVALRRYLELVRSGQGLGASIAGDRALPSPTPAPPVPRLGLVPTMGALHPGHLSLMERARRENEVVVVSIFVNPLQFSPQEDFGNYPQDRQRDLDLCEQQGVDLVFAPSVEEFYGLTGLGAGLTDQLTQVIPPLGLTQGLCGRSRPTHFQGVTTVVTKLLSLVQPDRAYFGQKDAQQLVILRHLVRDLNLPTQLVGCPIVREPSGLALSSRNAYLSPDQRHQATVLSRALGAAQGQFRRGERSGAALLATVQQVLATEPGVVVEYAEVVDPDTLTPLDSLGDQGLLALAAQVGPARLIDNVVLRQRHPIVALDGPAGAGKSTVTRRVAAALGLLYLDTGAMYRAVTWLMLDQGLDLADEPGVAEVLSQSEIRLEPGTLDPAAPWDLPPVRVWVNGQEVTAAIRTPEVTARVSRIAAQAAVRSALVQQQRRYGKTGGIVAEGRDIGTTVFPDAEVKIFLTASIQERARRRQQDLINQGQGTVDLGQLEAEIGERDRQDSSRSVSPLIKAPDALELLTDGLTIEAVTDRIVALYRDRVADLTP